MKKSVIAIVCTSLFVAAGVSAKSDKMTIFDLYNHEMHNDIFSGTNTECTLCHQNGKSYSREKVNLQGCHKCHNNPKQAIGPQECTLCHNDSMQQIKPRNHGASWLKIHGSFAKQDGKRCATCHGISWCVDCHQQRDTVRQTMHPRNFRFMHSIEARANPAKCDRCHQVAYCTSCHTQRKI